MQQDIADKVRQNPKYAELVKKRTGFAWLLSMVMLGIYYAFIIVIAFQPSLLATPISEGSVITVGIPVGVIIIISAFILTGFYVHRANTEFDVLTDEIKKELK